MESRYGDDIMGRLERDAEFSSFSIYGADLTSRTLSAVNKHCKHSLTEIFVLRVKSLIKCLPVHFEPLGYHSAATNYLGG